MKKQLSSICLIALFFCSVAIEARASIYGPWRRYRNENLGIEVPYVDDWVITPMKNCVVFAMQLTPDPYVRLAIGKVPASNDDFEKSVDAQIALSHFSDVKKSRCLVKGSPAIRIEGMSENGRILDYYIDRGSNRYWIGFVADEVGQWDQYSQSFDMILSDLQFI